ENAPNRKGIDGYPFDKIFDDTEMLGTQWNNLSKDTQDKVLQILTTVYDQESACMQLAEILENDKNAAQRLVSANLPKGWGRAGPTATDLLVEKLKEQVISARVAEDQAGLHHAMSPDGVIYDALPYYGEILVGHTM